MKIFKAIAISSFLAIMSASPLAYASTSTSHVSHNGNSIANLIEMIGVSIVVGLLLFGTLNKVLNDDDLDEEKNKTNVENKN